MKLLLVPFLILAILLPQVSRAKDDDLSVPQVAPVKNDKEMCPISMELNSMEKDAFIGFHIRLSHLHRHFGKNSFDVKLSEILEKQWPTAKVIETSPLFVEKVLNMVEQQYLKHAIASTIGLDHPQWEAFFSTMKRVTLFVNDPSTTANKYGLFTKTTEKLMKTIRDLPVSQMKKKSTKEEAEVIKARVLLMITNMFIYLERQSIINSELIQLRAQAAFAKLTFNLIRYGSVALLIASTVYAGHIIAIAGAAARGLVADAIVASQLAKLGQIAAGGGLGMVGAPVGYALTSSTEAMYQAETNALNNGTVFACELNKKFKEWRSQGASPYLKASLTGGGLGLVGGSLTLTRAGAQFVLYATTFGVGVGQSYALYQMHDNNIKGLAEYRMAIMANDAGDKEAAIAHLQKSREYFQSAGEKKVESMVIGILSISFAAGDLKAALTQGEEFIRVMYANSSDTLPQAFQSAIDLGLSVATGE